MELTLVLLVVLIALAFEYINGFHDTANSIATVVATKVLSPGQAVLLAAATNLVGALLGTAVAKTIASGLIDTNLVAVTPVVLICALLGAVIWNLITWWWGLPSSSSHALVGGLCGAALAAAHDDWGAIIWAQGGAHWWGEKGVLPKVVMPMVTSPIAGFVLGLLFMGLLFSLIEYLGSLKGPLQRLGRTRFANAFFGKAQLVSASAMGLSHGMNDAQKTMGIIALALAAATASGTLDGLPDWLRFLRIEEDSGKQFEIALWIKVLCALVMAAGTAVGGWRIIKTLGHKMVKLHPINGFAAETASASVILTASHFGIPVSTTHNISAAILGVGVAKRANAIRWTIVERMVWAWILTLPVTGGIAWLLVRAARALGFVG
ncbi:inorganic phosphate transporter [Dokdonella fugitiva]|jgi:PiT family inorganic phosphate transporter|uniref:Phosphate transporter n=1 Tax=Dokdonella fugitiva TaxID=328517 RepID=A0A4R2IBQ2_9GAMM|nr:inorganic phosphate transporter [Dokdonella fugitiva]MBA8883955.1 PiT family inorganic phosphate transporter [Dokdonella fugitiva]TCO41943.1 PiT family inorganic phosphate transporter [Dokdonella fugitiva]